MKIRKSKRFPTAIAIAIALALVAPFTPATAEPAEAADPAPRVTTTPTLDTTSALRNPAMGWQLYAEEFDKPLANATTFWNTVGPYASVANELYIRVPWSRLEPTQGHYAWNEDANFIALVQGARDRGIRLGFRIVLDSTDVHMQATPQYVFDAGATSYANGAHKDPYYGNAVFRSKFSTFLQAFGAKYGDPAVTDFIDGFGIGNWGEMANVRTTTGESTDEIYSWFAKTYSEKLPSILIAANYPPTSFSTTTVNAAISEYGLSIRRDSLGSSTWFGQSQKDTVRARFPQSIVFAENCYQAFTTRATSCDGQFNSPSTTAMLQRVVDDATYIRANTLDLRWPEDVVTWVRDNRPLVDTWARTGGYRLAPSSVEWPSVITNGVERVTQKWVNDGIGRLPNDQHGWNGKYRVAYALLNADGSVASRSVDQSTDPGTWVKGTSYTTTPTLRFPGVANGSYRLAYAIVDTTTGSNPALQLAVQGDQTVGGWHVLGNTQLRSEAAPALPSTTNHWKFDESGTSITDSVTGTATTLPASISRVTGQQGGAVRLTGQSAIATNLSSLSGDWTASLWVRRTGSTASSTLLSGSGMSIKLEQWNNTGKLGLTVYGDADLTTASSAPLGQWSHLAFVASGGSTKVYLDGFVVGDIPRQVALGRAYLGGANRGAGPIDLMKADLDDLRIYSQALSATQVAALAAGIV